jgi:hypothetical protein
MASVGKENHGKPEYAAAWSQCPSFRMNNASGLQAGADAKPWRTMA